MTGTTQTYDPIPDLAWLPELATAAEAYTALRLALASAGAQTAGTDGTDATIKEN